MHATNQLVNHESSPPPPSSLSPPTSLVGVRGRGEVGELGGIRNHAHETPIGPRTIGSNSFFAASAAGPHNREHLQVPNLTCKPCVLNGARGNQPDALTCLSTTEICLRLGTVSQGSGTQKPGSLALAFQRSQGTTDGRHKISRTKCTPWDLKPPLATSESPVPETKTASVTHPAMTLAAFMAACAAASKKSAPFSVAAASSSSKLIMSFVASSIMSGEWWQPLVQVFAGLPRREESGTGQPCSATKCCTKTFKNDATRKKHGTLSWTEVSLLPPPPLHGKPQSTGGRKLQRNAAHGTTRPIRTDLSAGRLVPPIQAILMEGVHARQGLEDLHSRVHGGLWEGRNKKTQNAMCGALPAVLMREVQPQKLPQQSILINLIRLICVSRWTI